MAVDKESCVIHNGNVVTTYASVPVRSDSATFFAFDDHAIPFRENLRVKMRQAEKNPNNPVVPHGQKGEPDYWRAQYYGSVVYHEGKYKMWYVAADEEAQSVLPRLRFFGWRPAYAESTDGVRWTKPNLGFVEYNGSRDNNLLAMDPPDAMGIHLVVLYEPQDPDPCKRFKMLLDVACHLRGEERSTCLPFYSADGLRWKSAVETRFKEYHLQNILLPPEHFEQSGLYKWGGLYYITGQQKSPWTYLSDGQYCGRIMSIFRSRDLINWASTKTLAFVRDGYRSNSGGQGEESHLPASIWNRGNVLIGLYGQWHGSPRAEERHMNLGLVISNDGIHFREPVADFPFIPFGEDGKWDQGGLISGQGFEHIGGKTYIWYGAWDLRDIKAEISQRGDVGLVTMRRDSFGSIGKKEPKRNASFVTCPFFVHRPVRLLLNVEGTTANNKLRVELLDQWEELIPGFSKSGAALVDRAGVRVPATWKSEQETIPEGGPYRLKVTFAEEEDPTLELYALYLEASS